MPGTKGVVFRFVPPAEGGQAVLLPDGGKSVVSPGQDLVDVGLMPRIPDDLVPVGVSKTWWRATVSSVTPRLAPKWPPTWDTTSICRSLASLASSWSSWRESFRMSLGVFHPVEEGHVTVLLGEPIKS